MAPFLLREHFSLDIRSALAGVLCAFWLIGPSPVAGSTRGSVQGHVVDPAGRTVPGAQVTLTSRQDASVLNAATSENGDFAFTFVSAGSYRLEATASGFAKTSQVVEVRSGETATVSLRLQLSRLPTERLQVRAEPVAFETRSAAVRSSFAQSDVGILPGASETLQAVLAKTNTAWYSQEHLHIRGAHQVGYQVNGVEVPDLSLFGAITPFTDPRNIKYAEVTTGGLLAEYGNRTAGVVNVISRSGFDHRTPHGELEVAGGSLDRGSLFGSLGSRKREKLALYVQAAGLVSGRAFNPPPDSLSPFDGDGNGRADILDPPASQTVHNFRRTLQTFGSFDFAPNTRDRINLTLGGYRTDLQIPNTLGQQEAERDYIQLERDMFQNLTWTRTLSTATLIKIAGYHHFNRVEVRGQWDEPQIPLAGDNRRAHYYGGLGELARHRGRHLLQTGFQTYVVWLRDNFLVLPNPLSPSSVLAPFSSAVPARAFQESLYLQDQFNWTDQWTLSLGARLDLFQARYDRKHLPKLTERDAFLSPRLGFAYRVGSTDTVLFANFAYLYLAPPVEFFELPPGSGSLTSAFPLGVAFTPTRAERDLQYDVGVRLSVRGFRVRANQWFKRQMDFLDHAQLRQLSGTGQLINPNIFLPVNLDRGRTHGVEVRVQAPSHRGLRVFANYSLNYAQARGSRSAGFLEGEPPAPNYFFLDHDQRHAVTSGAAYEWEKWGAFVSMIYSFGSGFPDASEDLLAPYFEGAPRCATPNCRLPSHSTFSFSFGKELSSRLGARLEIENLTNRVYPINLGSEFNGSHVSPPRLLTVRLSYRF